LVGPRNLPLRAGFIRTEFAKPLNLFAVWIRPALEIEQRSHSCYEHFLKVRRKSDAAYTDFDGPTHPLGEALFALFRETVATHV
jgi:hypothetical protein